MTIPRHLAPTVGPSASAAGVFIRTGLTITTGERVASGLIWRFGSLDCVSDNAGCFADRPFPAGGNVISFGGFDVYVATVAPPRYPREIVRCASPPPGAGASLTTTGPCIMQEVMATGDDAGGKSTRVRGPELERNKETGASASGPKAPPPPSRLDEVRAKLSSRSQPGDPTTIEKDLRRTASSSSKERAAASASGRSPSASSTAPTASRQPATTQAEPARSAGGRRPGRRDRPGRRRIAGSVRGATRLQHPRQEHARGASRRRRAEPPRGRRVTPPDKRVTEMLNAAAATPTPGSTLAPESQCCAASHFATINLQRASWLLLVRLNLGFFLRENLPLCASYLPLGVPNGRVHLRASSSRSRPPSSRREEEESERPAPRRQHRAAPEASGQRQPARSRLGPRVEPADARDRLDRLVESRIAEEEGPAGPKCFGPRILNEPMIDGFQLPRDTPKYDGTAKPEDWLQDYSTAVGIAKGNKRWAVRYSPLMLLGSARTWLNNLPAGSINGWLDFEEAFISNFTGTYRRPGRPQQLEMCKQGPDETDRAYLTRWCEMRNSCEGVHEIQAVGFFMAGCRPNTMLWHKLRRSEPKTMAALMAIADKYALAEDQHRRDNYRGKRHSDQPDRRYGSAHVAAVSDHAAAASRRQKQDRPWKPKYTFEQMLDSPCKYHSGKNPSNHTTRDCHFMKRLTSGEPLPPPPPPPPAGGPGGQAGAENANLEHHEANQVHHGGRYLAEDATYIIFTTEPEDKTSQQRRSLEVNAVMPPVPQYLNWSEQAITFDRRDTPAVLPKPGSYAMVLDPTIGTTRRSVRFSRVLIDGGSSINILYRDTARKLGIQEAELRPTPTVFHGIVPGHSCQPIGRITLEVMFGKPDNFRTENIEFEVVDLVSPYHALLGRPALTKFMAVPHYGYLKMKLPGPKGVITIAGDYRRSMDCATQSSKMAQTLVIATEKQLIHDAVALAKAAQADMPAVGNPAGTTHFQPANDTKKILLDPAQPDKFVTIGAGLSSK
ncbi:hypothetical protein QYE76_032511 [Lolium multiflorum]|uniref:Retrotransposon gag domain-containing protein n=1 Tax=Lolium multiflorum TaxID=4521 RepID=A0AAD8VLF6_LOLMU|nr:hypothetical protein QYE76_032511 [Lolium multiflorum]